MEKQVPSALAELATAERLSPQERLAASRNSLVKHMSRDSRPHRRDVPENSDEQILMTEELREEATRSTSSGFSSGTMRLLKRGIRTWWRHHPANFAVSVAQPLLGRYASQSPFQLLAISAAVGAAIVVIKPWKLVSMGGIALATLKSSEFSGLLMSMLSSEPENTDTSV